VNDNRNLNKLSTAVVEGPYLGKFRDLGRAKLRNPSVTSSNATITTHFDGIEDVFVSLCPSHEVIVGAVAWLTNEAILEALTTAERVAIVVQKEDFLRRDAGVKSYAAWRTELHNLYNRLRPFEIDDFVETYPGQQEDHPHFNNTVQNRLFDPSGMYQHSGEAVRAMGYARDPSGASSPLMHHKFLIFGEKHESLIMCPVSVVTGSFNLSRNASRGRENVVVIEDRRVCQAYLSEWAQLWGMAEPLNWTSPEPMPAHINMAT
jgi:phosphatidylserine/phosphatidylglycerophosphate/cardiolipin synthase-like enzyme